MYTIRFQKYIVIHIILRNHVQIIGGAFVIETRIVYLSLYHHTDTFINKISIGTVAYINLYKRIVTNGDIRFILTEIESNTKLDFELRYRINRDLIISYVDMPLY